MAEAVPSDEVDLLYLSHGSGWSTCLVLVDNIPHEIVPTHIFGHPLEALLDGFTRMLEGEASSDILWHDEPGRFEWHIERRAERQYIVTISISNCIPLTGPKSGRTLTIEFDVRLELFTTALLHQARKIRDLVKIGNYAGARDGFPHGAFDGFEEAYKRQYRR